MFDIKIKVALCAKILHEPNLNLPIHFHFPPQNFIFINFSMSTCFLQSASLHEARVGLLGSISSLQVGDRRGTDASAGEQAAEGLQAILHVGPVDVTAVGCATGVHHLEGGPQHLQQIPK